MSLRRVSELSSSPHPAKSALLEEPRVPTAEQYSGDLCARNRFQLRYNLVSDQWPSQHHSCRAKVAFVLNLLKRKAGLWASALWESKSTVLESIACFFHELHKVFDHPVKGHDACKLPSVSSSRVFIRILYPVYSWNCWNWVRFSNVNRSI